MKETGVSRPDGQAARLAVAVSKLRTGLRDARWEVTDLSLTQVSMLRTLEANGPATAADLAVAEHISPQGIAQQLTKLRERGYIATEPDPNDRRKTRVSLTPDGAGLLKKVLERREHWLAQALDATVRPDERADLERAIEILERLVLALGRTDHD